MNSDTIQLIGLAVVLLAEQYMIAPWQFPFFARIWNAIANLFGWLAWIFEIAAMRSRANYYLVVNNGS